MKKYVTPDMKVMAFVAEEEISANASKSSNAGNLNGSNVFNDASFGGW